MEVVNPRCAGLDVHKKTVVACAIQTDERGKVHRQTQSFATTTNGLLALADWLGEQGVTQVSMESTGVYWRAVFNILEGLFEVTLVNAQHMRAVPGRKTDVKDSEWLADLLRHGLLRPSFIPPKPTRDLRDLVRYRRTLVQERTREVNRVQKVLETANIKLSSVVSKVMGKSGRDMLAALVGGESDPEVLAALARGSLKKKIPQLQEALLGEFDAHHRILLEHHLAHIQFIEFAIEKLLGQIQEFLTPFEKAAALLVSIPGVQMETAMGVLAEIGMDMTCFPTDAHLASWAGLCPGHRQSGGKEFPARVRKGNARLKAILTEVVWVLSHMKGNSLSSYHHRQVRRLGEKKAVLATAHKILVIIYHLLHDQKPYEDLGADFYEARDRERIIKNATKRLAQFGFSVISQPQEEVSA